MNADKEGRDNDKKETVHRTRTYMKNMIYVVEEKQKLGCWQASS
jgi:hypothetical protein